MPEMNDDSVTEERTAAASGQAESSPEDDGFTPYPSVPEDPDPGPTSGGG